ncbi:FAD-dependent oxidoreductase [Aeromonas sp. MdU4]|uniref:FAD-dependent oxidoreductase n=1 Tax=Aeromonas sp. MdU4 TaxID=3342819 RepID=UPI0035B9245B
MKYSVNLKKRKKYDVVVVGGGTAGASAALSSARNGSKTFLVERLPFVGGTSTAVLDTFYGYYTPGKHSKKIVGGIPDEVVAGLKKWNSWLERPNTHGAGTAVTYNPEYLKVVWEELLTEAGVDILLNAQVVDVIATDDKHITGLVLAMKNGLEFVEADYFVDASGDADICHFVGFGYELAGVDEPAQTLTTTFKMVNVNIDKRYSIKKEEMFRLMEQAAESGQYKLPRRDGSDHITPVGNMTATIMTRLDSFDKDEAGNIINATDAGLLSTAEIEGRKQSMEYIKFLIDKVPGYEHASLSSFGYQIGIRETRRIYGLYRLTKEDVLSAKKFDDQIGVCGAPIEDHHGGQGTHWVYLPDGEVCGIPYRTLVPVDSTNLLVAGRCFSATHDAHASVRSMGQTMAMGQAAGLAISMAAKEKCSVKKVNVQGLRQALKDAGAVVDIEDENNG